MYIRQKIQFSSGNHVVVVLSSWKMHVFIKNRYNSTFDEHISVRVKLVIFKTAKQFHDKNNH